MWRYYRNGKHWSAAKYDDIPAKVDWFYWSEPMDWEAGA